MGTNVETKTVNTYDRDGVFSERDMTYRDIVEDQVEVICRFNADNYLIFVNDSCCRYFQLPRKELLGHSYLEFIHPDDRQKTEKVLLSLDRKNPVATAEHRVMLPHGETRWQQSVNRAIFDDSGLVICYQSVGRDLTDRILAERALRESEERYRRLISTMCHGFALFQMQCDPSGMPCDCIFLEVNPAFEQRTGIAAKDVIGKTLKEVIPETEQSWIDTCACVAFKKEPIQFKKRIQRLNRDLEIFVYSPRKGQFATIFADVTERIQMEKALRESENNFRMLAQNANDGILIFSDQGTHVYANQRTAEITGYTVEELSNINIEQLVRQDEVELIKYRHRRRLAGKQVPLRYEANFIKKNGQTVSVEITGSRTVWLGQPAVLKILRDVTLRKRVERAMGKLHHELERRVNERTRELVATAERLEEKQKELLRHKIDLEKVNKELVHTNTALSVLARNIDKKRDEIERKIAQNISSQIIPLVEELARDKIPEKSRAKLEVLAAYLNDLTPGTAKGHDIIISLSGMELRVAVMIKNGFSSDEIARLLHISPHTVKTHRRNIRRKLNIRNSKINLSSYLKLKLGRVSGNPLNLQ